MLFGLSPLFATLTKQTAFCTILAQTNHLESTLTCDPTSVDSKRLTKALTPLDATLTKNRGEGTHDSSASLELKDRNHHPAVTLLFSVFYALSIATGRSEEHTSELQSRRDLVCR